MVIQIHILQRSTTDLVFSLFFSSSSSSSSSFFLVFLYFIETLFDIGCEIWVHLLLIYLSVILFARCGYLKQQR